MHPPKRNGGKKTLSLKGKSSDKSNKWSHQKELEGAIGKKVLLCLQNGEREGILTAVDQFTLQVKVRIPPLNDQSNLTYFKSALVGYKIVE
ncbi:MAG: hypothetical protein JJ979_25720 [Roseibium sp.]|nr:hypothetical protein [Roseibium sp.]